MTQGLERPLTGATVLLLGIGFYDYEHAISRELERQGAIVFLYNQLPEHHQRGAVAKIASHLGMGNARKVQAHQKKILAEMMLCELDYVLVIKGENINACFLQALRSEHPGVQLLSYHWDSMARYPSLLNLQSFFDRVYTFDPADAAHHHRFTFLPLFYRPEVRQCINRDTNIDLFFLGWLHHDRLALLEKIARWAHANKLSTFFYLYTGVFSRLRYALMRRSRFINSEIIEFPRYMELLKASKIVVDLPHPDQSGLTMRAIEAVGAQKKLVTSSKNIVNYNFYNKNNIFIIDAGEILIDESFLSSKYQDISKEIIGQYSIENWVRKIFEF